MTNDERELAAAVTIVAQKLFDLDLRTITGFVNDKELTRTALDAARNAQILVKEVLDEAWGRTPKKP